MTEKYSKLPEPGTPEYDELFKIRWYDWFWLLPSRIGDVWYSIKTFFLNVWRFRKELKSYQGWDYGFDIDMLCRMYEIKVQSFEKAIGFIEDGEKLYKESLEILEKLKELKENDFTDTEYVKKYRETFKSLMDSYKFWW